MTGRDRILAVVVATAVVLAGAWFGLVSPQRAESSKLATQIVAAEGELANAEQETATALAAQKSYAQDAAAVARLGQAVPADTQTASLLYQLDSAAGNSKVKLESISPTTTAAPGAPGAATAGLPPGVTEMNLALSFSGRFADLQRFLRRAHSNTSVNGEAIRVQGRLLSIKSVQLTPVNDDEGNVTATVQATAYVATPAAPAAPGTPAAPGSPPQAPSASSGPPPTQTAMVGAGG